MNIINFGSCNIDFVYSVPHFVRPGETVSAISLNRFPGGKGLNQSIAIAKSDTKVYHAGCIGEDGLFLKELLMTEGADVTYLKIVDAQSGNAIIQVDSKGENSIILHGGANQMITCGYVDEVLSNFEKGDILVLQNEINNLEYIIDSAYNRGMRIVLNPSPFNEALKKIDLNKIFTLVLNEVEAFDFSGESEPEKICSYFNSRYHDLKVLLTLGAGGSVYSDSESFVSCPAYKTQVRDTTSAGDTFTGYYISGLMRDLDIEQNLKIASAASAIAVSKEGAAVSIPLRAQVEEIMGTMEELRPE